MITRKNLCFLNDINNAIKNDTYDEVEQKYGVDAWDIIERLLAMIKQCELIPQKELDSIRQKEVSDEG